MLIHTNDQKAALLANWGGFNKRQEQLANENQGAIVGNASTLPKDVWGMWDREAVSVQREVLSVFNDIASVASTPMPIGKTVHYFQTVSDSGEVNVSLDGRSKGKTDKPLIEYHGTPLPIIDSPFSFGWREVEAARSEGFQLDAAARLNSNFKVAEKLEGAVLDGYSGVDVAGAQSYGLRNHPKRKTRTTGQALQVATGAQWLAEFRETIKLLREANFYVPLTFYVNVNDWEYATSTDFKDNGSKTIAQRILELDGVARVVPASKVAESQLIGVVRDRRTVNILNGMPMSTRAMFRANMEDDYNFLTMAAAALEIKFDADDQCGVAVSTI